MSQLLADFDGIHKACQVVVSDSRLGVAHRLIHPNSRFLKGAAQVQSAAVSCFYVGVAVSMHANTMC